MQKEAPGFYKDLIKRSWAITKRNKFFWFLGLLSAVLVGAAGEYNLLLNNIDKISSKVSVFYGWGNSFFSKGYYTEIFSRFGRLIEWVGPIFWPILAVFIALGIYVVYLVLASEPSLIYAANKLDNQKAVSFSESFNIGKKFAKQSLILNLIGKVLVWLILLGTEALLAYLFMKTASFGWVVVYLVVSFILLLPIAIVVSFVVKFALAYVVLKGEKTFKALVSGWKLFSKHWLVSLETALIVFIAYFIIGLLMIILLALVISPLLLLLTVGAVGGSQALFWLAFTLAVVIFVVLVALIGSVAAAWQLSTWVLLFDHLINDEAKSAILHWAGHYQESAPLATKTKKV